MACEIPDEPAEFLREFKALLEFRPTDVAWIGRRDRQCELAELGLTMNQAVDLIKNDLGNEHRVRGPEPDDHMPAGDGQVCMYRCPIPDAAEAYVKIGLRLIRGRGRQLRGVIWSFKPWSAVSRG